MASDQFNRDQFNSNFQFDTKYEGHIPIKTSLIDLEYLPNYCKTKQLSTTILNYYQLQNIKEPFNS